MPLIWKLKHLSRKGFSFEGINKCSMDVILQVSAGTELISYNSPQSENCCILARRGGGGKRGSNLRVWIKSMWVLCYKFRWSLNTFLMMICPQLTNSKIWVCNSILKIKGKSSSEISSSTTETYQTTTMLHLMIPLN